MAPRTMLGGMDVTLRIKENCTGTGGPKVYGKLHNPLKTTKLRTVYRRTLFRM